MKNHLLILWRTKLYNEPFTKKKNVDWKWKIYSSGELNKKLRILRFAQPEITRRLVVRTRAKRHSHKTYLLSPEKQIQRIQHPGGIHTWKHLGQIVIFSLNFSERRWTTPTHSRYQGNYHPCSFLPFCKVANPKSYPVLPTLFSKSGK